MKNTILTSESWTGDPVNSQVPTSARRFARRSSLVHPPQGKIPAIALAANRRMQTNRINILGLACAALAFFTAGPSMADDNTGSGGTITYTDSNGANPRPTTPYDPGYVVHTFTSSDTLNIPVAASADVLVVGGGGGGGGNPGGNWGAGGGAGGLIYSTAFSIAANSNYTVTVGGGGGASSTPGGTGTNSVFGSLTALGGGGGGGAGAAGGSGGGAWSGAGGSGQQPGHGREHG